jgi:hypothetical protein
MSPFQPLVGFKQKMFFSVGPLSSANVVSSSKIQPLTLFLLYRHHLFHDLVQFQSFNLDFQAIILEPI